MPIYSWPSVIERVSMPAVGQTVNSRPFVVPTMAKAMTIYAPDLVGAAATLKLQSLVPTETVETTEVWQDVSVFDLTDGTLEPLDGIAENVCTVIPASAFGGGNLRFVASADQSSVPSTIHVLFLLD